MRQIIISFLLLAAICIVSCTNYYSEISATMDSPARLSVINNPDYSPHITEGVLPGNYRTYLKYFEGTDYEIGISSKKDGALTGGRVISCISGESEIKPIKTKSNEASLPVIVSYIDGIEVSQQNISNVSTKGATGGLMNSFGKTVTFSFRKQSTSNIIPQAASSVDLYIPKEIVILAPYAETEEDVNPLCYYKSFVVKWNEDCNNENGVLAVVEWYGRMVLGDDIEDTCVRRVASFPDTGRALLPIDLFDGIPDTAHCNLTLLRGNIDNVSDGQYSYKVLGETHQQISFILLRHIRNKK